MKKLICRPDVSLLLSVFLISTISPSATLSSESKSPRGKSKNALPKSVDVKQQTSSLLQLRCTNVRRDGSERTLFDQYLFRIDLSRGVYQEFSKGQAGWSYLPEPEPMGDGWSVTPTSINWPAFQRLGDTTQMTKTIDRTSGRYTLSYLLSAEQARARNGRVTMTIEADCVREPWTDWNSPPETARF